MRSMRFDYHEEEQALYLVYSPDAFLGSFDSLVKGMKSENGILLKKTFLISRDSVDLQDDDIDDEIEEIHIKIGELVDNYIRISPLIMMTEHNFYFSKDMKLTVDLFVAYRNISILRKIDRMIDRDLYIGNGGKEYEGISEEDYRQLVKSFPTKTELDHYANYRISLLLRNDFPDCDKYEDIYNTYLNRKTRKNKSASFPVIIPDTTNLRIEFEQFSAAKEDLEYLLSHPSNEKQWQTEVKKIILLIYPQYICSVREVPIEGIGPHDKKPDFILIDANGFIDVLEIKQPDVQILTRNPSYRNNYIPVREFSGAATQVEKYVYYLNALNAIKPKDNPLFKYLRSKSDVPESIKNKLSIVTPRGLLLLGRHNTFKDQEIQDFEIIKRQYKHIADIMTYDDLLQRLDNIVAALKYRIDNEEQLK